MTTDEKEDLIWSCIQPAANSLEPCNSDGYNENEMYGAVKRMMNKMQDKQKVDKWQMLMDKLNKWSEENEDGPTNEVIANAVWELM